MPAHPDDTWNVDFMTDNLDNDQRFRTLNIIDDFNREAVHIEVGQSLSAPRVIRVLEFAVEQYGYPKRLRTDNEQEFISQALADWVVDKGVQMKFIRPDTPNVNAYIERFNRTVRDDVLDFYRFNSLDEAQDIVTQWCWIYNRERSHTALKGMTPRAYRQAWEPHHKQEISQLMAVL